MAGRRTGGLGKGLDALIPNKAGGPSKEPAKKTRSAVVKKDKPGNRRNFPDREHSAGRPESYRGSDGIQTSDGRVSPETG